MVGEFNLIAPGLLSTEFPENKELRVWERITGFALWFIQAMAYSKIRFTSRLRLPVTWQVGLLPGKAIYRHNLTFWDVCSHTALNFSLQLTLHLGNNSERSKINLTPAASISLKSRLFHTKQEPKNLKSWYFETELLLFSPTEGRSRLQACLPAQISEICSATQMYALVNCRYRQRT